MNYSYDFLFFGSSTSIWPKNQAEPRPELSCRIFTFRNFPKSMAVTVKWSSCKKKNKKISLNFTHRNLNFLQQKASKWFKLMTDFTSF